MNRKKVMLIILDGWGKGDESESDIIHHANVPFTKSLYKNTPYTFLHTAGEDVGLPEGQMGNSEVGHLNMGAGRIVYQDLVKISQAVKDHSFRENKVLKEAFLYAKENDKKVHLFGLVSDGGVHSAMDHLFGLCDMADAMDFHELFVHAFTDGRDTDPKSGKGYIRQLEAHMEKTTGTIATVCGRYYAMDRDKRWERIKVAYDMLLHGKGETFTSAEEAIQASYDDDVTDEFIKPKVITDADGKALATLEKDDVVICFNFRTDRLREITTVLTQKDMPEYDMQTLPLHYATMTEYDKTFKGVKVAFGKDDLKNTLGEVLAAAGKTQLRIAETEKYPHVTFFFSGGREQVFDGEERVMIPSPKVATYDLQPAMSAPVVKDAVIMEIESGKHDFICLNFANADMVGHTGVLGAIREALETVDACLREVVEAGLINHYSMIITADHGNADYAVNADGSPNTAHTTNPVPCWLIDNDYKEIKPGRLADLAPTILHMMGVKAPAEMEGNILVG
ncbi:MAG: 2,3-bisphosphoglycerate-independent phosphoglycerate mutase [Bacteroidia bacterium]|nr:MAG: 2,3-bisphosphoglycerate-independent phosphoglycerate mutase [Bacteroidia bacterium]